MVAAYLLSAEYYEKLLDALDDLALAEIIQQHKDQGRTKIRSAPASSRLMSDHPGLQPAHLDPSSHQPIPIEIILGFNIPNMMA
ncbi:MAG: hypothetical protein PHE55_10060 [Methylococcaceae bacterium]|nr:hypothetical protein [Methylococcaceae bacterium]